MALDLSPKCSKCGRTVEFEDLQALPGGKGFACKLCIGQSSGPTMNEKRTGFVEAPKASDLRPADTQELESDTLPVTDDNLFVEKEYICDECRYEFRRPPTHDVRTCPFCGKTGTVREHVPEQAQNLVDEHNSYQREE